MTPTRLLAALARRPMVALAAATRRETATLVRAAEALRRRGQAEILRVRSPDGITTYACRPGALTADGTPLTALPPSALRDTAAWLALGREGTRRTLVAAGRASRC